MKFLLALFLACTALACGVEPSRDEKIAAALAQAEKFAAAEKWHEALEAGDHLRTLCRELNGEEHPDNALAELFLGEVRDHLGDHALAESHFRRALEIQEKVLPADAPELITTLSRLAACLKDRQAFDEAAGLLQRALDVQVKLHGSDDEATATATTNLARIYRLKRDYERAAALLEKALAIERRALGGTAPETIDGLRELAQVRELAGQFPEAELATAERVVATEAQFGDQAPELVSALSDWGRFAEAQQHFGDAEKRYGRALKVAEPIFPADAPALAACLTQLGWCLRELDRYDDAQPLLQRALDSRLRVLGPEHLDTAWSDRDLGWIYRLKRDFTAALPLFEKALAIREKALGATDPLTIESLSELGDLHWLRGDFDQAAALLERRRYRVEQSTGAASAATAAAWHGLAVVYESAKRWSEATDAALRCLRSTEQRLGPADAQTLGEMILLSRICQEAGALAPALTQYSRLAAWFEAHPEANGQSRAELLRQYAIATLRAGRADDAAPLFRESQRVHESVFGPADPATLRSIGDLWTYYDETRQPALALEVARELAMRTEKALGSDAAETAAVFERLAQLELSLGENADALKDFRRTFDARQRRFGDDSAEALDSLAQAASRFEGARDFAIAASLRTERLGAVQRKCGYESEEAAAACGELAWSLFRAGDFEGARGMFARQLATTEKRRGADAVETLTVIARLGDVAIAARDWPAALRERERLAAGCARHYGDEHLETARARLLLGEALLANDANARAETTLREAQRVIGASDATPDALGARVAGALARVALRRGDGGEAKRLTSAALGGSVASEESFAEAFSLLGDEWSHAHDDAVAESTLTAALAILTQAVGDHDEHTLELLGRVARLRLRLGRAGAVELLERALAAAEALDGKDAPETAEILGWLALAELREGHSAAARGAARRFLGLVQNAGGANDPRLPLARELEAWTVWRTATPSAADQAWISLCGRLTERWAWSRPWTNGVAQAFAEVRGLIAP